MVRNRVSRDADRCRVYLPDLGGFRHSDVLIVS
jgi:hypothetical protein